MAQGGYERRRGEIATYFDQTAMEAWARLTSDAPVSRIRATVRAGRDEMRSTILSWLPQDLSGRRILDAGCGTGVLALAAAQRGADVVAIDLSPRLVELAQQRADQKMGSTNGSVKFQSGDMLDKQLGEFDHVIAMDSLIHYRGEDVVSALAVLAERTKVSIVTTYAPSTPLLQLMHKAGKLFPKKDRSPGIVPVKTAKLYQLIEQRNELADWHPTRNQLVTSGFYKSNAMELVRR